jgi:M6 family metalloprotease-like protein
MHRRRPRLRALCFTPFAKMLSLFPCEDVGKMESAKVISSISTHLSRRFPRAGFFLLIVVGCALCHQAGAAPYGPDGLRTTFTQPSGLRIELRVLGDEFHAHTETLDGYTVFFDPVKKEYFYAVLSPNGSSLVPTGLSVGASDPARAGIPKGLRIDPAASAAQALDAKRQWEEEMGIEKRWETLKAARRAQVGGGPPMVHAPPETPTVGAKVGLTLLIDFDDDPATIPQAEIIDFLNGNDYAGSGNNGSVREYFWDNSNGLLDYTNVVTAYIRMQKPKSHYNDTSLPAGPQGNNLIKDALDILKASPDYETSILPAFKDLSVDGSNRVLACNVFYAGGNGGAWSKGLWPHAWRLHLAGPQELSQGGMIVDGYQITNIGDSLRLGTFCHENGHLLCGFPDIYDYDYDSVGGAGVFCLMNSGGHGTNPSLICAYLKLAAGWAVAEDIDADTPSIRELVATPGEPGYNIFHRLKKPGSTTEYFLLENRQATGRDSGLPASGIAIWHVDELGDHNNQSLDPNVSHDNYEVTLIQADGLWDFQEYQNSGDQYDLYHAGNSAAAYTNRFNKSTTPSATWWDGTASGYDVHSFGASAPAMNLRYGNPSALQISLFSPNGGETYYAGFSLPVIWYSNVPGSLLIELSQSGTVVMTIASGEANDGSHAWTIPASLPPGDDYTIRISSTSTPAIFAESEANFTIAASSGLGDALDAPDFTWSTSGNAFWFAQDLESSDGVDAVRSGPLADRGKSILRTSLVGPGRLTFDWKVSSEAIFDRLELAIDGSRVGEISGEVDWETKSLQIPEGTHYVSS